MLAACCLLRTGHPTIMDVLSRGRWRGWCTGVPVYRPRSTLSEGRHNTATNQCQCRPGDGAAQERQRTLVLAVVFFIEKNALEGTYHSRQCLPLC